MGLLLSILAVAVSDEHPEAAAFLAPLGLLAVTLRLLSFKSGFLSRPRRCGLFR